MLITYTITLFDFRSFFFENYNAVSLFNKIIGLNFTLKLGINI
jgi:hypothetical protein